MCLCFALISGLKMSPKSTFLNKLFYYIKSLSSDLKGLLDGEIHDGWILFYEECVLCKSLKTDNPFSNTDSEKFSLSYFDIQNEVWWQLGNLKLLQEILLVCFVFLFWLPIELGQQAVQVNLKLFYHQWSTLLIRNYCQIPVEWCFP